MGKHDDDSVSLKQASQEEVRKAYHLATAGVTQFLHDFAEWPEHGLFNLTNIIDLVLERLAEHGFTTSREAVCVVIAHDRSQLTRVRRQRAAEDAMRGC